MGRGGGNIQSGRPLRDRRDLPVAGLGARTGGKSLMGDITSLLEVFYADIAKSTATRK